MDYFYLMVLNNRYKRIALHILFWLGVWATTSVIYGYGKMGVWLALKINLIYLPIHIFYFYFLAYFLIPKLFLTRKYVQFGLVLLMCILLLPFLNRTVDIFIVKQLMSRYIMPADRWWENETIWEKYTNFMYYIGAFRGANLIVWVGIVIKYSKLWYERHNAALKAELDLLKAQVHPHFLFNTLNNLYSLTLAHSPKAPGIVLGLSEILRYMLYECTADVVSLKKDVDILESYILLERLRYEERLELSFSMNGELGDRQIAPLLLLPLVENAFKHGASEMIDHAWITIDLTVNGNSLKFKVVNNKTEIRESDEKTQYGNIGLANVRKRLQIIYPEAHQLKVFDEEELFAVILEIELDKRINP